MTSPSYKRTFANLSSVSVTTPGSKRRPCNNTLTSLDVVEASQYHRLVAAETGYLMQDRIMCTSTSSQISIDVGGSSYVPSGRAPPTPQASRPSVPKEKPSRLAKLIAKLHLTSFTTKSKHPEIKHLVLRGFTKLRDLNERDLGCKLSHTTSSRTPVNGPKHARKPSTETLGLDSYFQDPHSDHIQGALLYYLNNSLERLQ